MKFMVTWRTRPGGSGADNEQAEQRSLDVFSKWSPPPGDTFHFFLSRLDADGGYALVETDSPRGILDSAAKFSPWLQFEVTPVVDITDAVPVFAEAIAWRESIS